MNFLKVLWSDVSNIFRNRFIRASVIAVILIPLIYGGLYLAAFWDPYGKTENIPVAVVNMDKGGVSDDKKVNYGDDIVANLKDNDDLQWKFVKTQKEAEEGLTGDKYYAMMIIPKDFSQHLLDIDKGKLDKPKIIFVANKKKNYIVGLISDKASKSLKESVTKSIVDNFGIKVYDSLYEVRDGMSAAADGTAQIKDGVTDMKDKVPAMENGLNKLYDGATTLNDKLNDAVDGSNKLRDGLGTLNGKMPDLVDGVSRLLKGSSNLNEKIGDAWDGSKQLRDGSASLLDKMPDMTEGIDKLYDGSTSVQDGLHEVHDNMPKLVDGVFDLRDGSKKLRDGLEKVKLGSEGLSGGVKQLEDGASGMQSQLAAKIVPVLKANMAKLKAGSAMIADGINQLNEKIPKEAPVKEKSEETVKIANKLVETVNKLSSSIDNDDKEGINSNLVALGELLNGYAPAFQKSELNQAMDNLNQIGEAVPPLKPITDKLNGAISVFDGSLSEAKDPLKLLQGTGALKDGAGKIQTEGVEALSKGVSDLYDGSKKLYNGLDELYEKSLDLKDGTDSLYNGSQNLRDGIGKFKGTVPELTNGVNTMSDGTRDLSDGLFKIHEGSQTLKEKLGELNQKVPDLQSGVQELYDGSTDLSDGLLKLFDGSGKLKDGIKTLKDKIPDLQEGVDKLYEGVAQLNDKLTEGAKKVGEKLVPSSKQMGNFISEPVNMKDKPLADIDKYGEGLAPYFICLSLWVGALMMFFVITEKVNSDIKVGPAAVVMGKYLSYAAVGILQAIFISFAVIKLGLRPINVPLYYVFNIFLSLVFIAIMQNFIFLFGDVGRLLAVIVLLLQLTSSNGTFPGELLPAFFKSVGPFLPFTYAISAMREINWGINYSIIAKDSMVLGAMLIVFLTFSICLKKYSNKFKLSLEAKDIETKETNHAEV